MNEQTLELQIKSKSQEAVTSVDKLVKSLTNTENILTNIYLELGSIEKKSEQSISKATKQVDKLKKSSDKATSSANKLGKALSFGGAYLGIKRLTKQFLEWTQLSVDKTEQLNLFNVVFKNIEKNGVETFSTLGQEAIKFQNKLNEAFGTNQTETLKYQALFKSMGDNVGIPEEYSALMSETMTKFTYDLASLYNKTEATTGEALRAGVYAGQTKPLRSFGIDVTQTSMQPILDELGIERSVKQLSQAEKEILRYIATLRQGQVAMGDFANTIESPSNQIKVFRQQLIEAKVALSNLFIGAVSNILPYANALLMVVKEVSKAIADMFGIKISDYNTGIASQEEAYEDLTDSVDDTTDAVKELKRQTLGFDEIHNINENNDSGNDGIVAGGIDQRLLDAIKGYDNGMDKVRMKATEIRDRIMEWLGFTKEIDPLTGEVGFKLKDGETRFKKILDFVIGIKDWLLFALDHAKEIIGVIIGYKLSKGLDNIFDILNKISKLNFSNLSTLGKIGIGIGGATFLAEGVSQTSDYDSFVKSIVGDDYEGPTDLFGMWGEIGKGINELKNQPDWEEISYNNIMKSLAGLDVAKSKGIDTSYADNLFNQLSEEYYRRFQVSKDLASYGGIGINDFDFESHLEEFRKQLYSDYQKNAVENIIKYFGESFYNDEDAVNITTYTDKLKNYFGIITEGYDILDGYNEKIQNNNDAYSNASISLGALLTRLTDADYEPTAQEIERINQLFKEMGQISDDTAEENYQAVVKIISSLNQNGYASDELTEKIIDNAFKQKQAQQGATREQIEAMLDLEKQLRNGTITQQEYNKQIVELANKFSESDVVVGKAIITFDTLSRSVDITAGSYEEAQEAIGEFQDAHAEATQKVKDGTKQQIDIIEEQMAKLDTSTEEGKQAYEDYAKAIQGLHDREKDSLKSLDEQYALSLANMLQSLVNSKDGQTKEGKELQKQLNDELSKIGKGIDLNKNIEEINRQLDKITGKKNCVVTISAESDKNSFDRVKSTLSNLVGGVLGVFGGGFGGGTRAKGGVFSNGTWKDIPQYANGGAPSHGTVFVGGENGPEIVGHINGRTEVLNQSQIASTIYSAMVSAMSQFSGGGVAEINVHASKDVIVETAITGINQKTKQSGNFPLTIPAL